MCERNSVHWHHRTSSASSRSMQISRAQKQRFLLEIPYTKIISRTNNTRRGCSRFDTIHFRPSVVAFRLRIGFSLCFIKCAVKCGRLCAMYSSAVQDALPAPRSCTSHALRNPHMHFEQRSKGKSQLLCVLPLEPDSMHCKK